MREDVCFALPWAQRSSECAAAAELVCKLRSRLQRPLKYRELDSASADAASNLVQPVAVAVLWCLSALRLPHAVLGGTRRRRARVYGILFTKSYLGPRRSKTTSVQTQARNKEWLE